MKSLSKRHLFKFSTDITIHDENLSFFNNFRSVMHQIGEAANQLRWR